MLLFLFYFLEISAEWDLCLLVLSEPTWRLGLCSDVFKRPPPSDPLRWNNVLIFLDTTWIPPHRRHGLFLSDFSMELDRRLLLAHCAAHALSVAAGLLVVVPMALNGSAFKGRCALFSTGYWRTERQAEPTGQPGDVSHLVVQQWGPPAACQFSTFVGIFTVLYGAAQGWRCLFYLHGRHDEWVHWHT